jgi:hypothetical protein
VPAVKGAFVRLEHGQLGPAPQVIAFQFNPESVYRVPSLSAPPARPEGGGPRDATNQPAEPGESISFSLRLDATDDQARGQALARTHGVLPGLAVLERLLEPQEPVGANLTAGTGPYQHPPRRLSSILFFWGEARILPVTVTSLSINELEFDTQLHPIRAEVSVSLDVLTPSQLSTSDKHGRAAYTVTQNIRARLAAQAYSTPATGTALHGTLEAVQREAG